MVGKYFILNIFLFLVVVGAVQAQPAVDTIKYSLQQKPILFGNIGTRNSFIDNYGVNILELLAGLKYNDRVKIGIGYHQLYSSSVAFDKPVVIKDYSGTETVNANLKIWYLSILAEYSYYTSRKWEFSIPLHFGLGEGYYKYHYKSITGTINNSLMFVYEPAVSAEYKLTRWFGASIDIGYRFLLTDYKHFDQKLNFPTYSLNARIYYRSIYKHIVKKWKG